MIRLKPFTITIKQNRYGRSLAEMIVVFGIFILVMSMAMQIYLTGTNYFIGNQKQIGLQREAYILSMFFMKLARGASKATPGTDSITIRTPLGGSSYIERQLRVQEGQLVFIPDPENPEDARVLAEDVIKYGDEDIFSEGHNNVIRMRCRLEDSSEIGGSQWVDINVSAEMRNVQ